MYLPQFDLSVWHAILVGLAVQLACEAAALLFVASWAGRPWRERILAAVPFAAFIGLSLAARYVQAQIDFWSHYHAFLFAHYLTSGYSSLAQQTEQDYASVVESVSRIGWAAVLVGEGLAALYGVLMYHWFQPPRHEARVSPSLEEEDGDELEFRVESLRRPTDR